MEKQHLTYFKIENFKRFDSFEMSNLGQFNLIVGDNNVGKTSVLEGLLFDEDLGQLMINYFTSLSYRNVYSIKHEQNIEPSFARSTDYWSYIFKDKFHPIICRCTVNEIEKKFSLQITEFKDLNGKMQEALRAINNLPPYQTDWITLTDDALYNGAITGAYFETSRPEVFGLSVPLIPVNKGYESDLVNYFFNKINGNRPALKIIEAQLKTFITNFDELRVHRVNNVDVLGGFLTDSNSILPITRFGDGTVKFVRFLIQVVLAKNKRLMVDEIGSGIHFTRLTSYWKTIIQLCDKYQVQLFATTHSLECQQAFIEALEAPDMVQYQKDARNISLIENQEGEVKAITFDFKQFEYALNIGFNTRGGIR